MNCSPPHGFRHVIIDISHGIMVDKSVRLPIMRRLYEENSACDKSTLLLGFGRVMRDTKSA